MHLEKLQLETFVTLNYIGVYFSSKN